MVFERIDGVVRRADYLDVIVLHQAAGMILGFLQQGGTVVVNRTGSRGVQQVGHSESRLQLQVGPMVERVAHGVGNRLGPLLELLPVGGLLAGAVFLVDAVGTHGAPFVVVAFEPDFRQVVETVVLCDIAGNEVAMVVDNRHFGRVLVVEALGCRGLQQEVVVVELFHKSYRGFNFYLIGCEPSKALFHNVKIVTFCHSEYEKLPN